ncbi:MAG TPA: hypothetical protein VMN58_04535 [Acidimicrobiales bacterium]|nr:hypothetical protein [Acidimicrobiales bacterium]
MGVLLAWALGYVVGARSGVKDFDDVVEALKELRDSEEARDLWSVIRTHLAHALRSAAETLEAPEPPGVEEPNDLVDHVKLLMKRV